MKACECGSFWGPTWDHAADCRRWPGSEWDRDRHGNPGVGDTEQLIIVEDSVETRLWIMGFEISGPDGVTYYTESVE